MPARVAHGRAGENPGRRRRAPPAGARFAPTARRRSRPGALRRRPIAGTSPAMTPGARLSAAIELLDAALGGAPAERELTRWARASRFAGSKDRAAVRDLVYDGLRRRRSFGFLGGGDTGRAILLAREAAEGADLDQLFTGEGFDPAPVTAGRARRPRRRSRGGAGAGPPRLPRLPRRRARGLARRRLRARPRRHAAARPGRPAGQHAEDQPRRRHRRPRPRRGAGRAPPPRPRRAPGAGEPPPRRGQPRLHPGHGRAAGRLEPARRRDRRGAPRHDRARLLRRRRRQDAGAGRRRSGAAGGSWPGT